MKLIKSTKANAKNIFFEFSTGGRAQSSLTLSFSLRFLLIQEMHLKVYPSNQMLAIN